MRLLPREARRRRRPRLGQRDPRVAHGDALDAVPVDVNVAAALALPHLLLKALLGCFASTACLHTRTTAVHATVRYRLPLERCALRPHGDQALVAAQFIIDRHTANICENKNMDDRPLAAGVSGSVCAAVLLACRGS